MSARSPAFVTISASQLSDISRTLQLMQSQFAQLTDTITLLSTAFSNLSIDQNASHRGLSPSPSDEEEGLAVDRHVEEEEEEAEGSVNGDDRKRDNSRIMRALEEEEKRFERPTPLLVDRSNPTPLYTTNSKPMNVWRKAGQPNITSPSASSTSSMPSSSLSPTAHPSALPSARSRPFESSTISPQSPPLTSSIVALPPLSSNPRNVAFPSSSPSHIQSSRSPQLSAARRRSVGSEEGEDEEMRRPPPASSHPHLLTPSSSKRATTPLPSSHPTPLQHTIGNVSLDGRSNRSASDTSPPFASTSGKLTTATTLDEAPFPSLHPHFHAFPSSTPTSPTSKHIFLSHPNKIKLNVGGTIFHTTMSTLASHPSMLSSMFSGHFPLELDSKGAYFLDRDPVLFRHILNFLRDGSLPLSSLSPPVKHALLREAKYFGLVGLTAALNAETREMKARQRRELSQEKEYRLMTGVEEKDMAALFQKMTMMEGYDFEDWIGGGGGGGGVGGEAKARGGSLGSLGGVRGGGAGEVGSVGGGSGKSVHILFSKKLSRGELMLLDRLQTDM